MENYTKESHDQNKQNGSEHIKSALDHQIAIDDTTSQMKVSSKIEITITPQQLIAATWLFKQAEEKKPGWLRQKFLIDQRRRKTLNVELVDAQLDRAYCGHPQNDLDWDGLLHQLWHQINGVSPCK
jgi:hypothetical protein